MILLCCIIRLTEEDVLEDASIPLHYVKYQNIQNATVSTEI